MKINFLYRNLSLILISSLLTIASCKKDSVKPSDTSGGKATKIGLYEIVSSNNRGVLINITKVGSSVVNLKPYFDTGIGGLVLDANGILPSSFITSSGFSFSGDSTVVNNITITNQTKTTTFGGGDTLYGNLAYAQVVVGNDKGNVVIKRVPFYLYYKAVASDGSAIPAHAYDLFGASSRYSIVFSNNVPLTCPFSYYDPGNGLIRGYKMDALGTANFSAAGNYEPVLTIGLTQADLNSGFFIEPLINVPSAGYIPVIPGNITYVNVVLPTEMEFSTGYSHTVIMDENFAGDEGQLKPNAVVQILTTSGFKYLYTVTATNNITLVANPYYTGTYTAMIGLDFFTQNEFLLDLQNHQMGIKNN